MEKTKGRIIMKRTKLAARTLPHYTRGEEIMNMVTHIAGGGLSIPAVVACLIRAATHNDLWGLITGSIYGLTLLAVFTMSAVYHGLRPGTAKKVLQILDHCCIYFLIAGTYTHIVLCAIRPIYPAIGWGLMVWEWGLCITAATLTAIDLKAYKVFSMTCYIGMGWSIVFFLPQTLAALTPAGFGFLLAGGIAYTVGAVLFGLGKKIPWMHAVFHLFVILGAALQWITVMFYVI